MQLFGTFGNLEPEVCGYGTADFADIREFLQIRIDTDIIFDNPTDTDRIRIANH